MHFFSVNINFFCAYKLKKKIIEILSFFKQILHIFGHVMIWYIDSDILRLKFSCKNFFDWVSRSFIQLIEMYIHFETSISPKQFAYSTIEISLEWDWNRKWNFRLLLLIYNLLIRLFYCCSICFLLALLSKWFFLK